MKSGPTASVGAVIFCQVEGVGAQIPTPGALCLSDPDVCGFGDAGGPGWCSYGVGCSALCAGFGGSDSVWLYFGLFSCDVLGHLMFSLAGGGSLADCCLGHASLMGWVHQSWSFCQTLGHVCLWGFPFCVLGVCPIECDPVVLVLMGLESCRTAHNLCMVVEGTWGVDQSHVEEARSHTGFPYRPLWVSLVFSSFPVVQVGQ